MTVCEEALAALRDINEGKDVRLSSSDFQQLESIGFIARYKLSENASKSREVMESTRARMTEIVNEKDSLKKDLLMRESSSLNRTPSWLYKKNPHYRSAKDRMDELENEERALRTKIVELVQSTSERGHFSRVNDEYMFVTFKGRELSEMIKERLDRVGDIELGRFLSEIEDIKKHFDKRSQKASRILKKISPIFPSTDEIHFRSAAVGLSGKKEDPEKVSDLFESTYKKISNALSWDGTEAITFAESLTMIADDEQELEDLVDRALELIQYGLRSGYDKKDQIRAYSIILSSKKDTKDLLKRTMEISDRYCPKWLSPAAFLATQSTTRSRDREDLFKRFEYFQTYTYPKSPPLLVHHMAAALMTSTNDPSDEVVKRYRRARVMLNQFNGTSMEVPAAMMALLPMKVSESMDNLRLASASIATQKLSLGGMENLSLGMKLLMNSATSQVEAGEKPPSAVPIVKTTRTMGLSVLGITGVSVASAFIIGTGILAFHQLTLHNLAVRDYRFHPVHMHYIYG
jgi:hypothetical protein